MAPFRVGGKPPKADIYTINVKCQLKIATMSIIDFNVLSPQSQRRQ